jgi:hypothetical protein
MGVATSGRCRARPRARRRCRNSPDRADPAQPASSGRKPRTRPWRRARRARPTGDGIGAFRCASDDGDGLAMGFARLALGRVSVIADAAAPMLGPRSTTAHAGTLSFEMTSGDDPLIVNCGPGAVRPEMAAHGAGHRKPLDPQSRRLCLGPVRVRGIASRRRTPGSHRRPVGGAGAGTGDRDRAWA